MRKMRFVATVPGLVVMLLLPMFVLCSVLIPAAEARMIGTQGYLAMDQAVADREEVAGFFSREDVRVHLERLGVDPSQSQRRVALLTDEEVRMVKGHIDDLPAGAGALEVIGIVFLVLLLLELVGVTDVFRKI